jgi:14-3-3 protein epsilon
MDNLSNEELLYCARISEQVERYPQMLEYMRVLINRGVNFDAEERNLLSVAYKNAVGPQRTSWRIMDTLEKKEKAKADSAEKEKNLEQLKRIKGEVETELMHTCMEIIQFLENTLVKGAQSDEGKIFFLKM